MGQSDFKPVLMREVEISQPLPIIPTEANGRHYDRALSLVRLQGAPLGMVDLRLGKDGLSAQEYAAAIWSALESTINEHLREAGLPEVETLSQTGIESTRGQPAMLQTTNHNLPTISVIVATHERPEHLAASLEGLVAQDYPHFEILVVDNAPSTNSTVDVVKRRFAHVPNLYYILERQPGVDQARNTALAQSRGEIIAITDDDVRVDEQWLSRLAAGFEVAPNVACVTGLTIPAEIETLSQLWFEQYGGFNKGYRRLIYDIDENRPEGRLYPYTAGMFGSSANMAIKADVLRRFGGFDPALGAGSVACAGGDIDVFFQVIASGYKLVYEPSAIVHHVHRRDFDGLRRQIYNYGVGLSAFLTKCILARPLRAFELLLKAPYGLFFLLSTRSPKNRKKQADYPHELSQLELRGMLYGPLAFLRSRRHVAAQQRQTNKSTGPGKRSI